MYSFDKMTVLLNDPVPTFNYMLPQHIPESKNPGSENEFTESKILCNAKLCRAATFPRRLLNIHRQDIRSEDKSV